MKKNIKTIKYFCSVIMMIVGFWSLIPNAQAATDFMTSWQTKTYTPDWYKGKALPTYQSFITVAFEVIEDGKVVDISKEIVRWYVDDVLLKNEVNGLGIKNVTVYNQKYGGDVTNIKVTLPEYKKGPLEKTISIPIKDPEVVIDVPFFGKSISQGASMIYAWPFFFNALTPDALGFQWTAGGKTQSGKIGEPFTLTVERDTPAGTPYEVKVSAVNTKRASENATKNVIVKTL